VTISGDLQGISVVVCTLNRSHYLRLCLQALASQVSHEGAYEVIIVDNGSTDDSVAVAGEFCATHAHFRVVHELRMGLAVARNAGVREAAYKLVAFTDDDAMPDPDWIARISLRFANLPDTVGVLGGEVRPIWEAPRPDWLVDELLRPLSAGLMWSPVARFMRPGEWLVEVNSIYRRDALLAAGGFPEKLGRVGDSLLSSEGFVNHVIERSGYILFYDPHIIVNHHIPPARLTRSWFRRRSFWQGVSMNLAGQYVEKMAADLSLDAAPQPPRAWEEIVVPSSAAAWAELFEDNTKLSFLEQLYTLENIGYLLQSQSAVIGR
jgi:glycosyltransferase involved in cell wall biosynthesis